MRPSLANPGVLLATWFGAGYLRPAPGTWGTLAALPFAWALLHYGGPVALLIASLAAYAVGSWAAEVYCRVTDSHDASEIVIDEVAGVWLTLAILPAADLIGFLAGFLLFRFADIVKPWPIRWLDRNVKGGFGVMTDDMAAGLLAGALLYALYHFGIPPHA